MYELRECKCIRAEKKIANYLMCAAKDKFALLGGEAQLCLPSLCLLIIEK